MVFIKVRDEYRRDCLINSNIINSIVLDIHKDIYKISIYINNRIYTYGSYYKTKDDADIKIDELLKLLNKNDEFINDIKDNIKELKDIIKYMPSISLEYNKAKNDFEDKIE